MRQKRVPLARKCVKNAYPSAESRRRIERRPRGVGSGMGKKCVPFVRKCVKNAYPGAESPFRSVTPRNPEMIADPNGIDFGTKTYRFGHFSGPSYRGAHAGWPAAIWDTRKRQKRVPLAKKSVKNMYPSSKSRSEPADFKEGQKHVPSGKKCVKNMYP